MIMSINLEYIEKICITCGCVYYVPSEIIRVRNESKDYFYCFNGHSQHVSRSASEILKEKYDKEISSKDNLLRIRLDEINTLSRQIKELKRQNESEKQIKPNLTKRKARRINPIAL